MSKLLVCAQSYPYPADQGGRIRYAHLLEALERAHEVRFMLVRRASNAARFPAPNATDVRFSPGRLARNSVRSFFSPSPTQFGAFVDRRSGATVKALARDADAFIAFEPRAGMHHRFLPRDLPRVIDLPDSVVLAARAQWSGHRGVRLQGLENLLKVRRLEGELVRAFDIVSVAGPADARWIAEQHPGSQPVVVPTAIDVSRNPEPPPHTSRAVFTGDLSFAPNADAVRFLVDAIWPRVTKLEPGAVLTVAGHAPDASLRKFLSGARCETAYSVPDIAPYLASACVVVAPMRIGSGIKVKVLSAMASGRPVVMSPLANEGIDAEPGREAIVQSDPDRFAEAIVELFRDDAFAARVARAGHDLARKRFSPEVAGARFLEVVDRALERKSAARRPAAGPGSQK